MAVINPEKIADILIECAETYILPRYKLLEDHEISTKSGPRDLVTQADIDVEAHLERVLPDLLPGSIVVGEESVSRGDMDINILRDTEKKFWVVDPVDGTHNFVHHGREFGIMLGCIINGQIEYGWIYDVLGKDMAISEKGSGAFIGSRRLQVAEAEGAENLIGHINARFFPKNYKDHIKEASAKFKKCSSLHCAAHEYLRIAKGEAHFSLYSRIKAWDHIPGTLMVEEAGGYVANWDKERYNPADHNMGLIAAASEYNWNDVFELFIKNAE